MKKGKLIVIEGSDCSGKHTQTVALIKNLEKLGVKCATFSFPDYTSPTGKIIAGPILAKPQYGVECYFPEGPANVPPKIASLYYAADRLYNISKIQDMLDKGITVVLDRYLESNMAHQGGKAKTIKERNHIINFIKTLEYNLLKLPKADLVIFLHMPTEVSEILKKDRVEKPDQVEKDATYLNNSEKTYLYLAKKFRFKTIKCNEGMNPRKIEAISKDVLAIAKSFLKL